MENKLLMAVVLTLSLGLILASASSAQPRVMAQSNTTSSSNNAKTSPNGSNQSSPSQPAKAAGTANQLEQMGNNTAFYRVVRLLVKNLTYHRAYLRNRILRQDQR